MPVLAIVVFATGLLLVLASARDTLGYDYLAYDSAARRALAGQPIYNMTFTEAGAFGLFYYPPPFILIVLPLAAILPSSAAATAWVALLVGAFVVGTWLLPVRRSVRLAVLLLAGLMWPFLYAVKLGQVGPILYLLFAIGWRWIDRDAVVGIVATLGTVVKIQPAALFAWAVVRGRWQVLVAGLAALVLSVVVVTVLLGPDTWRQFLDSVGRISPPITTPHNFTPGAIAFQMGLPEGAATLLQWATVGAAVLISLYATLRRDVASSYLTVVIASQLVAPLLWDHYAMLLLLPVAYLLERRQLWAAAIPVVLSLPLVSLTPPVAYPISFAVVLVATVIAGSPRVGPDRAALGQAA